MKILIIEDNKETVETINLALKIRWPEARLISTGLGKKGVELVEIESPDVVLLDLGLPDVTGFEVLKEMRSFSKVPIIIATVRADESDIVMGLELGADDYIVKPFGQLELLSRINALVRRQQYVVDEEPIVCGELRFGPSMSNLSYQGKKIRLTNTEGIILYTLMKNAGTILSYVSLAESIWGDYYPGADDNLRVYIRHLREKIESDPHSPNIILTKIGLGYYIEKPG